MDTGVPLKGSGQIGLNTECHRVVMWTRFSKLLSVRLSTVARPGSFKDRRHLLGDARCVSEGSPASVPNLLSCRPL